MLFTFKKISVDLSNNAKNNKTVTMTSSKSAANTPLVCKGDNISRHGTNHYLVSKPHRKQQPEQLHVQRQQLDAVEIHKQDNTNGTSAADVERIIFRLANNAVNKTTGKSDLFKVNNQSIRIMQTR